jgi:hypothetical protein
MGGVSSMADTGKPFPSENQQRAGVVATLAQRGQEFLAHVESAAHALHGLDDDGGRVLGDVIGDVGDVTTLDPADVEGRTRQEVPLLRRAEGGGRAGRGAAVETLLDGSDMRAAGPHLERHLEGVLVGLGAGVDPEHAVERELAELQQLLRGARADFHGHGVGLEIHLRSLVGERLGPALVAVTQRCDGVAAIQIQHLAAVARVQPHAFRADDFDRVLRVNGRQSVGG